MSRDNREKKTDKIEEIAFEKHELIPAVVQDVENGEVLMLAYMNRQSLEKTLETGLTWFWSRSRQKYWQKGESSGHIQEVKAIHYDCDADTLLIQVKQTGPACHTGERTCFFNLLFQEGWPEEGLPEEKKSAAISEHEHELLPWLTELIRERARSQPEGSYVASLLQEGKDGMLKKVVEEAAEVVIASKNDSREELVYETADLLFHLLVLLEASGVRSGEVVSELISRKGGNHAKDVDSG